jgi:hypothetical protein
LVQFTYPKASIKDIQVGTEEAFSSQKRHPALQNMKFLNFLLILWVIFDLLDPDPDSENGSGSTDLIESRSETMPVTEVGVLITAVGVPVTAVGVPVSSFDVSEEVATAAAVVDCVVGVTGKLQNCMIVVTKVHVSDPDSI